MRYIYILTLLVLAHQASAQWERLQIPSLRLEYQKSMLGTNKCIIYPHGMDMYLSTDGAASWHLYMKGLQNKTVPNASLLNDTGYFYLFDRYSTDPSWRNNFGNGFFRSNGSNTGWEYIPLPISEDSTGIAQIYSFSADTLLLITKSYKQSKYIGNRKVQPMSVYLSDDKGNTWQKKDSYLPKFFSISIVPSGHRLLASCVFVSDTNPTVSDYRGIISSDDRGLSWYPSNGGLPEKSHVGLSYSENDIVTAFVQTHEYPIPRDEGYFVSSNQGASWSRVNFDPLYNTYSYPETTLVSRILFPLDGQILLTEDIWDSSQVQHLRMFRTKDFGGTWDTIGLNLKLLPRPLPYQIKAKDGYLISYDTESYLLKRDLIHYEKYYSARFDGVRMYPVLATSTYLIGDRASNNQPSTNASILKLESLKHWMSPMPTGVKMYPSTLHSDGNYIMAAGTDLDSFICIIRSIDNGASWERMSTIQTKLIPNYLKVIGDTLVLTAGVYNTKFFISIDKGLTWQNVSDRLSTINGQFIELYYLDATLYLFDDWKRTLRSSRDLGVSWDSIYRTPSGLFCRRIDVFGGVVFLSQGKNDYDTTSLPQLLRSSDNGKTWISSNYGLPSYCNMKSFVQCGDILFTSATKNPGDGTTRTYYSHDYGRSWLLLPHWTPSQTTLLASDDFLYGSGYYGSLFRYSIKGLLSAQMRKPESKLSFEIYPNPSTSECSLIFNKPVNNITVEISDEIGRTYKVLISKRDLFSHQIGVKHLTTGNYFINVADGSSTVTKVLKIVR